jgi:hypothetical protein
MSSKQSMAYSYIKPSTQKDLMKKFNMAEFKAVSTPISTTTALDPDENGEAVDQREYMSMIGL